MSHDDFGLGLHDINNAGVYAIDSDDIGALAAAMRDAGLKVSHAFVVFHYGIFPSSTEVLAADGITLHALATWWDVLAEAKAQAAFDTATLTEVEAFLSDPRGWQEKNG